MMLMGDEYGHTRYGNNNSYGHDTAINNFQWQQVRFCEFIDNVNPYNTCLNLDDIFFLLKQLDARKGKQFRFFSEVIKFRRTHPVFRHENFLSKVHFFTPIFINYIWALASLSVVLKKCYPCRMT